MVLFAFGNYDFVSLSPARTARSLPSFPPRLRLGLWVLGCPTLADHVLALQACRHIPSLPTCNLFFRQLLVNPSNLTAPAYDLLGLPASASPEFLASALSAYGVGVNPICAIPRMAIAGGLPGSLGNIANMVLCGLAVVIGLVLAVMAGKRAAAVGRVEVRILFVMFALVQLGQLVDTGAFLVAGGRPLVWVSAVHLGLVVGLFWCLVWVAVLSLQVIEDGTLASVAVSLSF